jgi:hypothetical protein
VVFCCQPAAGFLRLRCDRCGKERLLPFACRAGAGRHQISFVVSNFCTIDIGAYSVRLQAYARRKSLSS